MSGSGSDRRVLRSSIAKESELIKIDSTGTKVIIDKEHFEKIKTKYEEQIATNNKKFEEQIGDCNYQIDLLQNQIKKIKKDRDSFSSQLESLRSENQANIDTSSDCAKLEKELEDSRRTTEAVQNKLSKLQKEFGELFANYTKLQSIVNNSERVDNKPIVFDHEINELNNKIAELTKNNSQILNELENSNKENKRLLASCKTLNKIIGELRSSHKPNLNTSSEEELFAASTSKEGTEDDNKEQTNNSNLGESNQENSSASDLSDNQEFGNDHLVNMELSLNDIITGISPYSGKPSDLESFINQCESYYELVEDAHKLQVLKIIKTRLKGEAYNKMIPMTDIVTWDALKAKLKEKIQKKVTIEFATQDLSSVRQKSGESVEKYGDRVRIKLRKLKEASRTLTNDQGQLSVLNQAHEKLAVSNFETNISNESLRLLVTAANKSNLDDAISYAMQRDLIMNVSNVNKCTFCSVAGHSESECYKKINASKKAKGGNTSRGSTWNNKNENGNSKPKYVPKNDENDGGEPSYNKNKNNSGNGGAIPKKYYNNNNNNNGASTSNSQEKRNGNSKYRDSSTSYDERKNVRKFENDDGNESEYESEDDLEHVSLDDLLDESDTKNFE